MHELSIALSLIEVAQEEAERHGASSVSAIHLRLGELSGVVKQALLSCYEMASEDTPLQGSRLVIEDVPIVIFCQPCQERRTIASAQLFCCPECNTPSGEILQGREMEVVALELS